MAKSEPKNEAKSCITFPLQFTPAGGKGNRFKVTVVNGVRTLHSDTFDLGIAKRRKDFVTETMKSAYGRDKEQWVTADLDRLNQELMSALAAPPGPAPQETEAAAKNNFAAIAKRYAEQITPKEKTELATLLQLPPSAVDQIPQLGWVSDEPIGQNEATGLWETVACWTWPEVDARGKVLGINRRFVRPVLIGKGPETNKARKKGGKAGLLLPVNYRACDGPILLVQSESDVMAGAVCGLCCVGRPPAASTKHLIELLQDAPADRAIVVIAENDKKDDGNWPGKDGAETTARKLANSLQRSIQITYPPESSKGLREWFYELWSMWNGKGRPGIAAAFIRQIILEAIGRGSQVTAPQPGDTSPPDDDCGEDDERHPVRLGADEHRVNDEVTAFLSQDVTIYQRGGDLVRVSVELPIEKGPQISSTPRIEVIPPAALRDAISRRVLFLQKRDDGGDKPAHPPAWCVSAVGSRGTWPGIRPLTGVVPFPVIRPDGSILTKHGYDQATGLYLHWPLPPLPIPDRPTRDDARTAAGELLDVVCDVPFQSNSHKASWLAGLLTPSARPAISGPSPLFLVEGNIPGVGKGLNLEVISRILTGDPFPVISYPTYPKDREEELRKKITTFLLYGDRIALFDNLTNAVGDGTLDRALTGTDWQDRILGGNRQFRGPLSVTFYATGNNVSIASDTARRICQIRLESDEERPEERTEFKRPQLIKWVMDNRGRLLANVLTILRAFHINGRPDQNLKAWGSFESWSAMIRNTVVWCGLPDPGETRLSSKGRADENTRGLRLLIAALKLLDPAGTGKTASELVKLATREREASLYGESDEARELICSAIEVLVQKPDSSKLGYRLRSLRRRIVDGFFIDQATMTHGNTRWKVYPATEFRSERPIEGEI